MTEKTQTFITKAKAIHGDLYDYSLVDYINSKTKVKIICYKHGVFEQTPNAHLDGHGCKMCAYDYRHELFSKSRDKFVEDAQKIHGTKYDYSQSNYINNHKKVKIICPEHGIFTQTPANHLRGVGCPICSKENSRLKKIIPKEQIINKANLIHNNRYDYDLQDYNGTHSYVRIKCPVHGWYTQYFKDHLAGCGCPKCVRISQQKVYERLCNHFKNENILYEVGHKVVSWIEKLRFDIYFPKYNIAVEYNGQQHYYPVDFFGGQEQFSKQQNADAYKAQLCKINNCKLFVLKYDYTEADFSNLVDQIETVIHTQ